MDEEQSWLDTTAPALGAAACSRRLDDGSVAKGANIQGNPSTLLV